MVKEKRTLNRKSVRMLDGGSDNSVFPNPTEGRTSGIRR